MELVTAILCCVTTHKEACQARYMHKEISAGNVLQNLSVESHYVSLFNDRALSEASVDEKTDVSKHHFDRTGTWQFMSVHALINPRRVTMVQDELESSFHVMLYIAICFLPHNCIRGIDQLLFSYFDNYSDGIRAPTSGPAKYHAMNHGEIDVTLFGADKQQRATSDTFQKFLEFYIPRKPGESVQDIDTTQSMTIHPINSLIAELLGWLKPLYALDYAKPKCSDAAAPTDNFPAVQPALFLLRMKPRMSANSHHFASSSIASSTRPATPAGSDDIPELAQKLESHHAMEELLLRYLTESDWPAEEKLAA